VARGRLTRVRDTATARAATDPGGTILCRDGDQAVAERVHEIAGKRGLSPAQVALARVMRHPGVTSPVVGVTKPAQPAEALAAVDVELDEDEAAYLEEPYQPHEAAHLKESFYTSRPVANSRWSGPPPGLRRVLGLGLHRPVVGPAALAGGRAPAVGAA
jgi:1-deoxyxylulose-5-phosphate synthase